MQSLARKLNHTLILSGLIAALIMVSAPGWSAEEIGDVRDIVPSAFGTPPQEAPRALALGSSVVSDEAVQTGKAASVHIKFLDGTDLRMGAESLIFLDELIYDPDTSAGAYIFELAVGIARFVSGDINHEDFTVKTRSAVIGIRGTDFIVDVADDDTTRVAVLAGSVIVTPLSGPPTIVGPGQTVIIAPTRNSQTPIIEAGINIERDPGLGPLKAPSQDANADGSSDDDGPAIATPNPNDIVPRITPTLPTPPLRIEPSAPKFNRQ